MLFGQPAYNAQNIILLIQSIQSQELLIPRKINNISPETEDVLRRMLTVDVKKRIDWEDLFNHPINGFLERKIQADLDTFLKGGEAVPVNVTRFYLKQNKLVKNPNAIQQKEELNEHVIQMAKSGVKADVYQGVLFNKQTERSESELKADLDLAHKLMPKEEVKQDDEVEVKESLRERAIRLKKANSVQLLHQRNLNAFLLTLAEEAFQNKSLKSAEICGFFLAKLTLI